MNLSASGQDMWKIRFSDWIVSILFFRIYSPFKRFIYVQVFFMFLYWKNVKCIELCILFSWFYLTLCTCDDGKFSFSTLLFPAFYYKLAYLFLWAIFFIVPFSSHCSIFLSLFHFPVTAPFSSHCFGFLMTEYLLNQNSCSCQESNPGSCRAARP